MKCLSLLGFFTIVVIISYTGSIVTMPAVATWYQEINKPSLTPPNWVFAPVWTTLYVMIAISGWMAWQKLPNPHKLGNYLMLPYWIQLVLNFLWSIVFFGMANFEGGAIIIIAMLIAIWLNIKSFYKLDKISAYLLAPYFAWVAYATSLNIAIVMLN